MVTPAVASRSVMSKLALAFWPPTFWTLTTIAALVPWITVAGAFMFTAISAGGITITEIAILLFDQTSSGSFWVANSVWPFVAAPAVLHGMSTVALAPTARPATARVPTTGPLYPSVSSTLKLVVTSSSPAFFTVTTMCAVSPRATRAGAVIAVTAISVGLAFTVTTA